MAMENKHFEILCNTKRHRHQICRFCCRPRPRKKKRIHKEFTFFGRLRFYCYCYEIHSDSARLPDAFCASS